MTESEYWYNRATQERIYGDRQHDLAMENLYSDAQNKMSKRDYIATMAMQGLSAHPHTQNYCPEQVAEYAVKYADALLVELKKTNQ